MAYALYDEEGNAIGGTSREVTTKPPAVAWTPPSIEEEQDSFTKKNKGMVSPPSAPEYASNAGVTNFWERLAAILGGGSKQTLPGSDFAYNTLRYVGDKFNPERPTGLTGYERFMYYPQPETRYTTPNNFASPRITPQIYGAYGSMPQVRPDLTGNYPVEPTPYQRQYGAVTNNQYPGFGAYSNIPTWVSENVPQNITRRREAYSEPTPERKRKQEYLYGRPGRDMKEPTGPYQKPKGWWDWWTTPKVDFVPLDEVPKQPPSVYGGYAPRYYGYGGGGGGGGWGGYAGYGGYGGGSNAWLQGLMNWNIG